MSLKFTCSISLWIIWITTEGIILWTDPQKSSGSHKVVNTLSLKDHCKSRLHILPTGKSFMQTSIYVTYFSRVHDQSNLVNPNERSEVKTRHISLSPSPKPQLCFIIHPFLLWRGTNTNPGAAAIRTLQCQSCRSHLHQISDRATLISNRSMKWRNAYNSSHQHITG